MSKRQNFNRYYLIPKLFFLGGFILQTLGLMAFEYLYMTSCTTTYAYITLLNNWGVNPTIPLIRGSYLCYVVGLWFFGIIWSVEKNE